MEAPCKARFLTWRPLVRHSFYLEVPCKALFFIWRPLVRPFFVPGGVLQGHFFNWRSLVRFFCLLGDYDDDDYVGVGVVVHTLFFYLEAPVRPVFLLGGLL